MIEKGAWFDPITQLAREADKKTIEEYRRHIQAYYPKVINAFQDKEQER